VNSSAIQTPLFQMTVLDEADAVATRRATRLIGATLGLDTLQQTRVATAVSETVREALLRANGARVDFGVKVGVDAELVVTVAADARRSREDDSYRGRRRRQLQDPSLLGARHLVDSFDIRSDPDSMMRVVLGKSLPGRVTSRQVASIATSMGGGTFDLYGEVREQNEELLSALEMLGERQDELVQMTDELEDTNRGIVALFAQMEEQALRLREANDTKNRFLSFMSHEIRTPLSSVIVLARLLVDEVDGSLNSEQLKQARFIYESASSLNSIVNDLLDLAKVQSGKLEVNVECVAVERIISSLRGTTRPLSAESPVVLQFDDVPAGLEICSDEMKITQILRNFISNALKFTECGVVRVSVKLVPSTKEIVFRVHDTGIGIAPEDREKIFEEFTQVSHPIQQRVRGTGLGLPLSRQLAGVLGGRIDLESEQGKGSTFSLILPPKLEIARATDS
jgi:signal transduction histidine kinase